MYDTYFIYENKYAYFDYFILLTTNFNVSLCTLFLFIVF